MTTTTQLQGLPVPEDTDAPTPPAHLTALATAVEKRLVMVFASAADRTAKLSSAGVAAAEGMVSWLQDTNTLEVYDGAAWRPVTVGVAPDKPTWATRNIAAPNAADFTGSSYTTLHTFPALTLPLWARDGSATAEIVVTSNPAIITGDGTFQVRAVIGATNGPDTQLWGASGTQYSIAAPLAYAIPNGTTALTVALQAQRSAGAGGLRLNVAGMARAILDILVHR